MKTKFSKFLLAMFIALPSLLFSQNYPLQVILTPSSNFTSYFGELKENPGRYMQVRVINNSGASRNVYFQMRIERLYPSTDISVYSNIEKKPDLPIPIAIGSNSMRMDQLDDNFATHQYEDFAVSGIEVNSVDDLMGSFRIPEGQYKLCLIAYDYDTPIGSEPVMLSDPNFSCAQVKICYSASKIELISPVNTMIAGNSSNVVIQPKRNLLVQWTQPTTTCGASMGNVDYELKFTDIYDGQTEEDALNYNPILLSLSYKNKTSVMLDTMQYQGIFNNGKRYAIGVTATASNQDIAILNDGKTTPASFIYGELPPNKGQQNTVKSKPSITNVPDCGNAVPDNKELIATLNINDIIHVGNYDMKLTNVSKNGDRFDGTGTINLIRNSLFSGSPQITAKVEFEKLQVNTANQVIDGIVRTVYDDVEKQKVFGEFGNDPNWASNNLTSDGVDSEVLKSNVKQFIKNFLKPNASQVQANVSFPIKVPTSDNNSDNGVNILITSMSFGAKGASVNMLSFMEIPETETMLAFGAQNVCINNDNISDAKIYLFKNIKTTIEGLDFAIIGGDNNTYVDWNNQGFQGIKLSAKLSVPDGVIIAKDGKKIDNVGINTSFNSWSNWEAEISIPDFKLAFCQDLSFDGLKASYVHKIGATGTVIKGIFLPNLNMNLPDYIKGMPKVKVNSASIVSNEGKLGFNLSASAYRILSINNGSIGGWGLSVDTLIFNIVNNQFINNRIAGEIKIPFFEKKIAYGGSPTANENALNLGITVNIGDKFSTKFLHYFNAEIAKTSKINIGNDGKIEAVLNGGVKVDEKSGCDFGFSATFSGFTIGTNYNDAEPKLDLKIGNWGTSTDSNNTWNGFGFQIKEFAFKNDTKGDNIELEFSVSADLQLGEGKFKIAGACKPIFKFDINKKTKEVSNPSFTLGSVMVEGEFSAVKLYGYLHKFDNDAEWGNGIRGDIDCTFPLKLQVKSKVCFGSRLVDNDKKKYFFADAAFKLPPGSGIPLGAISIYGFGGAFWWNLAVSSKDFSRDTVSDKNPVSNLSTMSNTDVNVATSSGIKLVPYTGDGSAFGFAADVYFCSSVGGPYMYNGQVGLGLAFENGNFGSLNLNGKIRVIGDGDEDDSKYVSTGEVGIEITDTSFSASAKLNVNVLGVAKAVVPLGLRFDWKNGDFAFELGKPYYRPKGCDSEGDTWCIGSEFNIPGVLDINVTLQGYFCAGTLLNYDMPPLPQRVIDLLGSDNPKVKPRGKAGTKKESAGIMMGTRYSLDFNFSFGPLYAKFESDIGFDLEIKQSKGQQCADGRKIEGLNGYYCRGQLYAFIAGDVGVQLKFFGSEKKYSLCSIEAGALLRGGFPNPTWFKGAVAIKGEILGGLISFNTSARFTVGSECKDPNQQIDIVFIDEISPGFEKQKDAENQEALDKQSVYTVNTISTNVPINTWIDLDDITGETEVRRQYEFKFSKFELRNIKHDKIVPLKKECLDAKNNNGGKSFKVQPADELERFSTYKLTIGVKVYEIVNNRHVTPRGVSEKNTEQIKEVFFATNDYPNFIHKDNITSCYPSKNQYELYKTPPPGTKWYIETPYSLNRAFEGIDVSLGENAYLGELTNIKSKEIKRFLYTVTPNGNNNGVTVNYPGLEEHLINDHIYQLRLFVVRQKQKDAKFTRVKETYTIAEAISSGGSGGEVDTSNKDIKDKNFITVVDKDKNLGGTKVSEGKHTGKVYEAIRGEQDARTNPLDGILRDGMSKGREIINQGSIANKGSQITNQGNIVGGLSQGSVAGGVGIGNQAMNQGQVTTYSNTGGTTTKSKAMPAIPSGSNMSSNVASNGKVKEPAGTVSTISQIGKNNVGHINQIHYNIKNIIMKEQVDETKTTYEDYKDVISYATLDSISGSNNVTSGVVSSSFVEKVTGKEEDAKYARYEDMYKDADIHEIYCNYFRVSEFNSFEEKQYSTDGFLVEEDIMSWDLVGSPSYKVYSYPAREPGKTKEIECPFPRNDRIRYKFQYRTTKEEIFGGKTVEDGANAIDMPATFQCVPRILSDNESMLGRFWDEQIRTFLLEDIGSEMTPKYVLPYKYDYWSLRRDRANKNLLENMDIAINYTLISPMELFQGPLTDDEISTGHSNRAGFDLFLTYHSHQANLVAMHLAYAMNASYQIKNNNFWSKPKYWKDVGFTVRDKFNESNNLVVNFDSYNFDKRWKRKFRNSVGIAYYFGSIDNFKSIDDWLDKFDKYCLSKESESPWYAFGTGLIEYSKFEDRCNYFPFNFYNLSRHAENLGKEIDCLAYYGVKHLTDAVIGLYPKEHYIYAYIVNPVTGDKSLINVAKKTYNRLQFQIREGK